MALSEPEHSLTIFTKALIGSLEPLVPFSSPRNRHTMLIHSGAEFPNSFGGSLGENTIMRVRPFILVDGEGILVGGVERKSALLAFEVSNDRETLSHLGDVGDGLEEFNQARL